MKSAQNDECSRVVIYPAFIASPSKGKFLTGSIEIKSDVNIYLEEGAVLLVSDNPNDYNPMETKGRPASPKNDGNSQLALLLAPRANNISIYGKGIIDGQGRALALNIDSLNHAGIRISVAGKKRSIYLAIAAYFGYNGF
ncbi:MAG: hypothetical protein ABI707_14635 [Ferruginibacter sp.]